MVTRAQPLNYRKIQDLEYDDLFLAYMQHPLFRNVCSRAYGQDAPVASFRAMFMNKPAGHGHDLTWHQDRWTDLDRDPLVTVWTALDPSTIDNGCVKIIPGSHKWGLINPENASGFLNLEQKETLTREVEHVYLELEEGEVVLPAQLAVAQLRNKSHRRSPQGVQHLLHACGYPIRTRSTLPGNIRRECIEANGCLRLPDGGPSFIPASGSLAFCRGTGSLKSAERVRYRWEKVTGPHALESGTSSHAPPSATDAWLIRPGSVMSMASWIPIGQGAVPTMAFTKSRISK